MAAKRGLRRLIQRAAKRVRSKNTVPTPSSKTTLQKAKDVRTKAKKASTTKVQTAPPTRKIGTKATLNGKPVYWDGKGWSKETPSQQITSKSATPKKKQPVKPSASQPPVKKKAPQKIETKKPTKSSTVKSPATRAETLKTKQSRKGVVPTQVSRSKQQAVVNKTARKNTSSNVVDDTTYLAKKPSNKGVANQRDKRGRLTKEALAARRKESRSRLSSSKTKTPTQAQKQRAQKVKDRDIGKAAAQRKLPSTTRDTVQQAKGKASNASIGGGIDRNYLNRPQPKATNSTSRVKGEVREMQRQSGRDAAAGFKEKANKIIAKRVKDETKGMTALERQTFKRKLTAQMNKSSRKVKQVGEKNALKDLTNSKSNQSVSAAYQEPHKNGRTWRDRQTQKGAERLSKEMTERKANGKLPKITQRDTKKGITSSDSRTDLKIAKPSTSTRTIRSQSGQYPENAITRPTPSNPKFSNKVKLQVEPEGRVRNPSRREAGSNKRTRMWKTDQSGSGGTSNAAGINPRLSNDFAADGYQRRNTRKPNDVNYRDPVSNKKIQGPRQSYNVIKDAGDTPAKDHLSISAKNQPARSSKPTRSRRATTPSTPTRSPERSAALKRRSKLMTEGLKEWKGLDPSVRQKLRRDFNQAQTGRQKMGEVPLEGGTKGSYYASGVNSGTPDGKIRPIGSNDGTKSRQVNNAGTKKTKDGRSNASRTQAQQTLKQVRERRAIKSAGQAIHDEMNRNFHKWD